MSDPDGFEIRHVSYVDLTLSPTPLAFETDHTAAIEAHWKIAQVANPALFNGTIFMASTPVLTDDCIRATCHPTRFASLQYWRARTDLDGAFNIFANTVLRASDGALVMGRMAAHTSIAGRVCYPGGSLDEGDVRAGKVDAASAALRECLEETGFGPQAYATQDGFVVCSNPRRIAISRIAKLRVDAETAKARTLGFMAQQAVPEFDDIIIVRSEAEADRLIPDRYERDLAMHLFQEDAR